MVNKLEQLTVEKEKRYEEYKSKIEKKLTLARDEYQTLLQDFNNQVKYVNESTEYSPEGKINKSNEILNRFIDKVNYAAVNHYDSLNSTVSMILKEYEKEKLENVSKLTPELMPQLIYVNSMINNITGINDAEILESVFDYICSEYNFNDELVNMVHLKARSIINNDIHNALQDSDNKTDNVGVINRVANKKKISNIVEKIEKYKKDYIKEFESIANTFKLGASSKKYPGNIYFNKDIQNDFTLMSNRINNVWKKQEKSNDPWAKYSK